MRRSFTIIALFIATLLTGLALEIATPSLAMAAGPEPFELPQWEPRDINIKPGTCVAQYDGMTSSPIAAPEHWWQAIGTPPAVEEMCSQYTRNKGWEVPQGCGYQRYLDCKEGYACGEGRYDTPCSTAVRKGDCWWTDEVLKRDYYCYCMRDAVTRCSGDPGSTKKSTGSKPKTSLVSAFDKATELVEAVGRAIYYARAHPDALSSVRFDLNSDPRSGTRYRASSSNADELYAKGMRAYEKTSHTDAETLEALTSFGACIEEDPTHVPCLWELGWVLWVNGHYGQTKILWERVEQIDPNHEEVGEELRKLKSKL